MVYCTQLAHRFTYIIRNRCQLPAFLFLLFAIPPLSQAGIDTRQVVRVPISAVSAAAEGVDPLAAPTMTIPDWGTVTIIPDRTHRSGGSTLWTGLLNDADGLELVGTFALYRHVTGLVQGEVYLGGRTFVLLPALEDRGASFCPLTEQLEICSNDKLGETTIDAFTAQAATDTHAQALPTQLRSSQNQSSESPCVECGEDGHMIDVLFLYTDNDLIWAEGDLAVIQSRADIAIDYTNNAFLASDILDVQVRSVGLEHIDYDEYATDNPSSHLILVANLPEAQSLRNAFNADLVCAFMGDTDRDYGGFGFGLGGTLSVIRINVGVGVTFAHEFGHNLGLGHYKFNPDNFPPPEPVQYYFWSGHRWTGTDGTVFKTIMVNMNADLFVPRYSNPHVYFMGYPTGAPLETLDSAHNVLRLRLDARTVANYRQSGEIHDCDEDGTDDTAQIAANPQLDANTNGLLDACERRLYVNTAAPEAGDGFDWASPRRELNSALVSTQLSCSLIKEVWVAQGTYVPDQGTGERNRHFQILQNCDLSVLGGFDGTETQADQRDWVAHPTILSGEIGDVGLVEDNTYWVLNIVGVDGISVDGFAVTRGAALDPNDEGFGTGGGGIRIKNTSVLLANLFFHDNIAFGWGGAVVAFDARTIQFNDCIFADNTSGGLGGALDVRNATLLMNNCALSGGQAETGGALSIRGGAVAIIEDSSLTGNTADTAGAIWLDNNSSLDVARCDLSDNVAAGSGGALRLASGSIAQIEDSTLNRNESLESHGGAIRAWSSSNISLARCEIRDNIAATSGGGLYAGGDAAVDITDCYIKDNIATTGHGGALYVTSVALLDITASLIDNNTSELGMGGGLFAIQGSPVVLTDTDITNNSAPLSSGGGIRTWSAADLTITNCTIDSNEGRNGGGIVLGPDTTAWIEDSLISANVALDDTHGGGIRCDAAESLTLVSTKIEGNTAGGVGGGLYVQNTLDGFAVTITQSEFRNNTAEIFSGGAIRFAGSSEHATSLNIDQSLLVGNNAFTSGGAIFITGSQATMTIDNSTFAANFAWSFGSSIRANNLNEVFVWNSIVTNVGSEDGAAPAFYIPGTGMADVRFSLIKNWLGGGVGNIDADPVFVDVESGDFRLVAGSIGVDRGNNMIVPADAFDLDDDGDTAEPLPVDLDGSARFLDDEEVSDDDGGVPSNEHTEIIDMGCYEGSAPFCPLDVNGDGVVGPVELATLLGMWGSCESADSCHPFDANSDGVIDPIDLATLLGMWGPCP